VWSKVFRLSHNLIPLPHYSLFVTSIFILVHTYTREPDSRPMYGSYFCACKARRRYFVEGIVGLTLGYTSTIYCIFALICLDGSEDIFALAPSCLC